MKYKLYRSFGDIDKDVKKHELIAVKSVVSLTTTTGIPKLS